VTGANPTEYSPKYAPERRAAARDSFGHQQHRNKQFETLAGLMPAPSAVPHGETS
jgi:hypothetical protein